MSPYSDSFGKFIACYNKVIQQTALVFLFIFLYQENLKNARNRTCMNINSFTNLSQLIINKRLEDFLEIVKQVYLELLM